ncbi:TetR/AcrR family transcriptional regulator [Cellulomonas chengniuliangii]|uniref:TetR/AcrR family transcriptional regulator n=1 Tax=Cellulomonas chengniuliangii TaxID=2968084 RepID=UPI001D0ED929|nr:TetR/AcrR family transcriptional regulator [Cellulomonas chengniuliangii]MCC2318653.1 TetR/AcrR family transcriptional regulator [Cellulomonas chengniuliangii]
MNQRRDAQRNRARLIAAAAEVFREEGAAAPLDLVARRADVGRGTLYRHFPDRGALIASVLEMRVDALEQYARDYPGDDLLEHLLTEIYGLQLDAPGLITAVRTATAPPEPLESMLQRTGSLLRSAFTRARAARIIREDATEADVMLAIAMLDGAVAARSRMPDDASVEPALAIVLRGLRSAARLGAPIPTASLRLPTAQDLDPGA